MNAEAVRPGLFITFEGIEGVGKSTNLQLTQQWLVQQQQKVITTREPGGTPLAEKLRELLLLHWQEKISSQTELLLMFAGRAQHILQVIEPQLQQGVCVLCDRFTDATYAYQGYGRGLPEQEIKILENSVQKQLQPDVTFLLDAELSIGQQRVAERNQEKDRFEEEQQAFFQRVREGYLLRAQQFPERIIVIDAAQPLAMVQQQLQAHLRPLLTARRV